MLEGVKKSRLHTVAVLAALVLSACGGGGDETAAAPPAPIGGSPSDPGTPRDEQTGVVAISSDTQAESNKVYEVRAPAGSPTVGLTLPQAPAPGDTVTITGVSDTRWEIVQNPGQSIVTTGLPGDTARGEAWTEHLEPRPWWWLASNAAGDVRTAGEIVGGLFVSEDGGTTWEERLPGQRIWISTDMTPSGEKIVALAYNDNMYLSNDYGRTWGVVAQPAFSGIEWESVAISADGDRILAGALGNPLFLSQDGGTTWTAHADAGSWRGVAMSADGTRAVAVDQGGSIHISEDGGVTWTARPGTEGDWYRVGMSDDGQIMAAAERLAGGLVISRDGGRTWVPATSGGTPIRAEWTTAAVSGDGATIAVSASGDTVYLSEDGGLDFRPLDMPGTDDNWRSVALSADGNMMTAASGGAVGTRVEGMLYTSRSNRTSIGALGAVEGGGGDSLELEYVGSGQFRVRSSSGGPFTIR